MYDVIILITGSNFINTAGETTCMLEDWQGTRIKAFNIEFRIDP